MSLSFALNERNDKREDGCLLDSGFLVGLQVLPSEATIFQFGAVNLPQIVLELLTLVNRPQLIVKQHLGEPESTLQDVLNELLVG